MTSRKRRGFRAITRDLLERISKPTMLVAAFPGTRIFPASIRTLASAATVLQTLLVFLSLLLGGSPGLSSESPVLDVPLVVFDTAGVDRRQEVCSSGIWVPCGALKRPEEIAVFDSAGEAVPAQFRVLERWREKAAGKDDLSVRWLLVTFLADVPAGGKAEYRLKAGKNPAPATPVRIEEKGDAWQMGGLSLKKDFTAPFKLVLTDPNGNEKSTEGPQIGWSVWESGPVRACLRAESPTDHDHLGFIAWIYAYAGQQRWDMTLVLKNTPNDMKGPFYFKDFSVVWAPPEIKDAGDYLLGGDWGKPVAGTLEGGTPVYLMQASCGTDKWNKPDSNSNLVMDWTKARWSPRCLSPQPGPHGPGSSRRTERN
jgi:hypothetical protein